MSDVTTSSPPALRTAARSDRGRARPNNEDLPLVDRDRGVYGVIDGVGGHAAGEVAAGIARDVILQRLSRPLGTPAERVREAIALANNEIFTRAEASPDLHGMTCVVTLALIADRTMTIGHVGDSRLYELRRGGIRKLTHDHSPIGEREDAREISEIEAMRHPRRNEVFRDVGSAHRDKDEEDFVEVLQVPFEDDCAIVACSDGLTDMIPSAVIEAVVRRYAGRAEQVVDALVRAANDAGGRDNITVVYVEGPRFAESIRRNEPGDPRPNAVARAGRWVVRSRTTWFAAGALAGVVGALLFVWRAAGGIPPGARTLAVDAGGNAPFTRIADAMRVARNGDTVQLAPGAYPERAVVPDGVDLVARVPGSVTLGRAPDAVGEWTAITAVGNAAGRISGVRIASSKQLPVDVGVRITGQGRTVDLVEILGPMRAGVELGAGAAVSIQGSFLAVQGTALTMADASQATLANNVFFRAGPPGPPISVAGSAQPSLTRNVFAGFGTDVIKGVTAERRQQMLTGNFLVAAEPWLLR